MPRNEERLIVFTRLPEPGRNKTRLIPALGAEGAARFHDRLARHAIGRASTHVMTSGRSGLELRITGGTTMEGRAWLGDGQWKIQGEGDLGAKLCNACDDAFDEGVSKVVLIGTDCPSIDESALADAFSTLDHCDVVVGPAVDGGYYLIGLKARRPGMFKGIDWGGPEVFRQTMERAAELGLEVGLLPMLSDVDLAEDLVAGEACLGSGESVSVIIPTLDEAGWIGETLERVMAQDPAEVIVADGGSRDETVAIASSLGARVISGARGRGAQMNLGAAAATGEFLFFLHADTLPPDGFPDRIRETLCQPGVSAGSFRLGLRGDLGAAVLIERLVDLRCRFLLSPYGDQGLFVRRHLFRHLGGFPVKPLLEDVALVSRLRKVGRLGMVGDQVLSSDRRWKEGGLVRTFLRHQGMLAAHHFGLRS